MDELPRYLTSDNFNLVVKKLKTNPKVIFIDEIDYLMNNFKTVEILRDLHDETDCPIIMIGMGLAHRKLERYKYLYDRFFEILKFETFGVGDIVQIVNELLQTQYNKDLHYDFEDECNTDFRKQKSPRDKHRGYQEILHDLQTARNW